MKFYKKYGKSRHKEERSFSRKKYNNLTRCKVAISRDEENLVMFLIIKQMRNIHSLSCN